MNGKFQPGRLLLDKINEEPRNRRAIIGALVGYINADPNFKTNDFEEAVKYALNNGCLEEFLFEQYNSDYPIENDIGKWDKDYYSLAVVDLKDNFCRERIAHVKAVGKKLGASEGSRQDEIASNNNPKSKKKTQIIHQEKEDNTMLIMIGVVILLILLVWMLF